MMGVRVSSRVHGTTLAGNPLLRVLVRLPPRDKLSRKMSCLPEAMRRIMAEKKKLNPFNLIAGAGASILSMLAGSLFGIKGTIIGVGAGSLVSGTSVVLLENAAMKTHDKIKNAFGPDLDSTSLMPALKVRRKHRPWLLGLAGVVVMLVSAAASFGLLGIIKGATGTTLGNYGPVVAPAVTVTPTVTSSAPVTFSAAPSFSASPSPSLSLSESPSPTATPSPSLSPAGSPAAPSLSPPPSPSLTTAPPTK